MENLFNKILLDGYEDLTEFLVENWILIQIIDLYLVSTALC